MTLLATTTGPSTSLSCLSAAQLTIAPTAAAVAANAVASTLITSCRAQLHILALWLFSVALHVVHCCCCARAVERAWLALHP